MPFAALRGYYELIRERERIAEPLEELSEEETAELSEQLARCRRGTPVHIRHHDGTAYRMCAGIVTEIDVLGQKISVGGTAIAFSSIARIFLDEEDGL